MNKVIIKFWNIKLKRYVDMPSWYYFVDKNSAVYCESSDGMEEQLHIKAHFYKDGERIA